MALKEKVIDQILRGKKNLVFWGYNYTCVRIINELQAMGLQNRVAGIIDSDNQNQGQIVNNFIILSPQEVSKLPVEVLVISSDENKEDILRQFAKNDNRVPEVVLSGSKNYAFRNEQYEKTIASLPVRSIAGGYSYMLIHIFQTLEYLVKNNVDGAVAEFGVFQGGTLAFIAHTLRSLGWNGRIYGFDLFDSTVQKRSVMDVFPIGKYLTDYERVRLYCEPYDIELIKGDICETYTKLKNVPLMFSFFDTDYYSPTRVALELCYHQTVKGGILAFDHYFSEGWEDTIGERIAAKEILDGKPVFHLHGTGIFLKLK